jgi:hypothetical protein
MSIGTRRETSLHRDLKFEYAGKDGQTEAEVGDFVADGISAEGEYIEIQTGSFAPLRKKAVKLASQGRLKLVYPVIIKKHIEVYTPNGKRLYRRKSPKKGSQWDLFNALVYAPELPLIPNLNIELVITDAVEQRIQDGKGSWRRRGISIKDRRMVLLHERIILEKPVDYLRFLPFSLNEEFTSKVLAEKTKITVDLARKTLYVLVRLHIIEKTGKKRNLFIYRIVPSNKIKKWSSCKTKK